MCKQWVSKERVKDILSGDIADCILLDEFADLALDLSEERAENRRLQAKVEQLTMLIGVDPILDAENKRLQKALKFYADESHYSTPSGNQPIFSVRSRVQLEGGETARQALAERDDGGGCCG